MHNSIQSRVLNDLLTIMFVYLTLRTCESESASSNK
jgi:hypothetical protein